MGPESLRAAYCSPEQTAGVSCRCGYTTGDTFHTLHPSPAATIISLIDNAGILMLHLGDAGVQGYALRRCPGLQHYQGGHPPHTHLLLSAPCQALLVGLIIASEQQRLCMYGTIHKAINGDPQCCPHPEADVRPTSLAEKDLLDCGDTSFWV